MYKFYLMQRCECGASDVTHNMGWRLFQRSLVAMPSDPIKHGSEHLAESADGSSGRRHRDCGGFRVSAPQSDETTPERPKAKRSLPELRDDMLDALEVFVGDLSFVQRL
jgi:hypothetical protein